MAYSDLLEVENTPSQFLCVITPRRRETGFSVYSGSVYRKSFTYGYISSVEIDGVELTKNTSTSLNAGEYYYDYENSYLYVRLSDDSNPDDSFCVVFYELYLATFDEHWYRDPLDDTTQTVYFEPLIQKSPQIKLTTDDVFFGYMPSLTSSIKLSNAEHTLEKHIYDSSFNRASIKIWNVLSDLDIDNIKLVYNGFLSDVSYDQKSIQIKTYNTIEELNTEYRNEIISFVNTTDFPNANPEYIGKPIRFVYGMVDGFVPINIDYVEEDPTTSQNRDYLVLGTQNNISDITRTVPASPVSTATRTYLSATGHGINIGDSVFFDRVSGTDEYLTITSVGSNYIEHTALSGGAMASGDSIKRGFIGYVKIVKDNVLYNLMYGRDYTTNNAISPDCSGFTLTDNFEATFSIGTFLPTDKIYCRVYGPTNDVTLSASAFGSNDSDTANLTNPVVIIVDLLKSIGIPESKIDIPSFQAALALRDEAIGISLPRDSSGGFQFIKNIILDILKTSLIKFYVNDDLKYSIQALEPTGSEDFTIEDDEIIYDTFNYDLSYSDILSKINVQYKYTQETDSISGERANYSYVFTESDVAKYIHKIEKEKTFDSLHFKEVDAQKLSDRLSYIYGERQGSLSFTAKNRFLSSKVSDVIEITRTKMPGNEYDGETTYSKKMLVTGTEKTLNSININGIDNKGVDDNSSNW